MSGKKDNGELITLHFKPSQLILIFSALTFIMGLAFGYYLWGRNGQPEVAVVVTQETETPTDVPPTEMSPTQTTSPPPAPTQTPIPSITDEYGITRYDVPIDDDPILGPDDAPITIIEFSDYQCPACAKFHNETFEQLIENYGDVIRFVYRDFPLNMHPQAYPAAEAANCAGDQDKYWDFHDKLFSSNQQLFSESVYIQFAEELELDMSIFQECIDNDKHIPEIQADYAAAQEWGIRYSPTFYVNGIQLIGAQPYVNFVEVIDNELARLDD